MRHSVVRSSRLDINCVFNCDKTFCRASKFFDVNRIRSGSCWTFSLRRLPCSFVTYALLGSYTAQAELGDHNELDHGSTLDYLKDLNFAPIPDDELLRRIHEQHKRHKYVCAQTIRSIIDLLSLSSLQRPAAQCS